MPTHRLWGILLLVPVLAACDAGESAPADRSDPPPARPTPTATDRPECAAPPAVPLAQRLGGKVEKVVEACRTVDPLARDAAVQAMLPGHWAGEYQYDDGRATAIEVDFRLAGDDLAGDMSEPDTLGYGYGRLHSEVTGDVYGTRQVVFMKTYHTGDAQHSVLYQGKLDDAGGRIEGRWRVGGLTGKFWLEK